MNVNFGKHYASMYEGSLVGTGSVVFAVMGYVIANQKPEVGEGGERLVVTLNARLLALIFGEEEEDVEKAIEFLCQPDERSNTKGEGGRRLVRLSQFDFWVVNGRYYRDLGINDRRKEQNRAAQARYRAKKAGMKTTAQVRAEYDNREKRYVEAVKNGDEVGASKIAAEGIPEIRVDEGPELEEEQPPFEP